MTLEEIHCPWCGEYMDESNRDDGKTQPQAFVCAGCNKGWEVLCVNGTGLMLSSAPSFDKQELRIHGTST